MSNVGKKFICKKSFIFMYSDGGVEGEIYECISDVGDYLSLEGKWSSRFGVLTVSVDRLTNGQFEEVVEPQELKIGDLEAGEKYRCIKSFIVPDTGFDCKSIVNEIYKHAGCDSYGPVFRGLWDGDGVAEYYINSEDVKYLVRLADEPVPTTHKSMLCGLQKEMIEIVSEMTDCIALAD